MVPHRRVLGGGVTCKMARQGRGECAVRGASRHARPVREKGDDGRAARAVVCARAPRHPVPPCRGALRRGCREGDGRRDGAARGKWAGGACVTGSIRARKALEGRTARPPPLFPSGNRLLPHQSRALAGGRLEHEHAVGRARGLHRWRRHLSIEPPLARPLLAREHAEEQPTTARLPPLSRSRLN